MIQPQIMIYLAPPGVEQIDITPRVVGVRSISETTETDLTELVHGDIDFEVDNSDGWFENILRFVEATDSWEVEIVRETRRRRPKWEVVFGGVIDLNSITYERKNKTAQVQVFAFSQLLEKASAETIARTVDDRTGTVTGGTASVVVDDATDMLPGDEFSIADDNNSEDFIVLTISGTTLTATENLTNSYTSGFLVLMTPFLRNKSIEYLAGQVFDAAGIDNHSLALDNEPTGDPFATAVNTDGLGTGTTIIGLLSQGGKIEAVLSSGTDNADNPQDGFTNESGTTTPKGDWQPYQATEPGSLQDAAAAGDNGTRAFDHVTGDYYHLQIDEPSPPPDEQLWIYKDGVQTTLLDSANDPQFSFFGGLDWVPSTSEVWSSFGQAGPSPEKRIRRNTTVVSNTTGGGGVRTIDSLGLVAIQDSGTLDVLLYDPSTVAVVATITGNPTFKMWTMRAADGYLAVLYNWVGTTRLRMWDSSTFVQLADYEVSGQAVASPMLTVWDNAGTNVLIGAVGRQMFVVSRDFAGVIPYADFEDMSCADAIRDLALLSLSIASVDKHRIGRLSGRGSYNSEHPIDIGPPVSQESRRLWDSYRTSVAVTGTTQLGEDIEEVAGDTGDTEHRLELGSDLITSVSLAQGIAQQHLGYFSIKRSQEDVTISEGDRLLETLDVVRLDGQLYLVTSPETDLTDREQSMVLVSI